MNSVIDHCNESFAALNLAERLSKIVELSPSRALFTTSLGREDQVLTWATQSTGLPIRLVTLNTGRLFAESKALINETRKQYGIEIEEFTPSAKAIAGYVNRYGQDGFYNSIEARKACCAVRKIEPLTRALEGAGAWITGLTREQSEGRSTIPFAEWDATHQLNKFNPMADISAGEIEELVTAHDIPVNPLHDKGYPSIGCEPCTRAIKQGEHPRAGRWWWENNVSSECGLHVAPAGHPVS